MFPKFDFLFDIALCAGLAYIGIVIGNALFHFALTLLGA
jgi:hypothetical protein